MPHAASPIARLASHVHRLHRAQPDKDNQKAYTIIARRSVSICAGTTRYSGCGGAFFAARGAERPAARLPVPAGFALDACGLSPPAAD